MTWLWARDQVAQTKLSVCNYDDHATQNAQFNIGNSSRVRALLISNWLGISAAPSMAI